MQAANSKFFPRPLPLMEDTGLSRGFIQELVLKRMYMEGFTSLHRLVIETKLDYNVIEITFRSLQQEQLIETKRLVGVDYEIALTSKGTRLAQEAFRKSQYAGAAPVPLSAYNQAVVQQIYQPRVNRVSLVHHLSDLVLSDETIREIGAAIMTGGSLFLYGPTGSGKTSVAIRMQRFFDDAIFMPYAVEVSGQILTVYDPIIHQPIEHDLDIDPRWVLCRRPFVVVGGEMHPQMLEPHVDDITRIGIAPLQMKSNNGILVIDDFGRQRIAPRDLLNRWIVPLDRRIDHMALWSGAQFEVPFDVLVVFATNLELSHLAEEAFLRRIKNKIKIDAVTPELFQEILRRVCHQKGIALDPETGHYLMTRCAEHSPAGLRACFPVDLMQTVCGEAAFEEREATLDRGSVDRAIRLYFAR